jgi:DNA replication protein DnaC
MHPRVNTFDPQAASLFMLLSRRYESASPVVTSNKPFSACGEVSGGVAHGHPARGRF